MRKLVADVDQNVNHLVATDLTVQRNLEALSEMGGGTLALQAEGQRKITASLESTHEVVSRLAGDVLPPAPTKATLCSDRLCSENIAVQSEDQRALNENL